MTSSSIDYSQWQSCMHDDEPRDQQRDLASSYWAEVGPDDRNAPGGWSWTILLGNDGTEVDGGFAGSEDAAKTAVQQWADDHADELAAAQEGVPSYKPAAPAIRLSLPGVPASCGSCGTVPDGWPLAAYGNRVVLACPVCHVAQTVQVVAVNAEDEADAADADAAMSEPGESIPLESLKADLDAR